MSEIRLDHLNKGPVKTCERCGGKGTYYEPPFEVQMRQVRDGSREVVGKRVCPCTKEGRPCHSSET